jgi:nucleoside-diphosphate-sugar epimerase
MPPRAPILITGASGFVGACLAHRITADGCDTHLLDYPGTPDWRIRDILPRVTLHPLDITDVQAVEQALARIRPRTIFHLATYGAYPTQQDVGRTVQVNVTGTWNLLSAAMNHGFDAFINTGSSSEYGFKDHPMSEDERLEPVTHYAITKATATMMCQAMGRTRRLPILTLRPFSVYGFWEEPPRLVPWVIKACLTGTNPTLTTPNPVRDFVFTEDFVDAYLLAAENAAQFPGEVFNIGSGRQTTVGEMVERIIRLTNSKVKPEWEKIANPRIEPGHWCADPGKARTRLGWQPRHNLEQGLNRMIDWMRGHLDLYR